MNTFPLQNSCHNSDYSRRTSSASTVFIEPSPSEAVAGLCVLWLAGVHSDGRAEATLSWWARRATASASFLERLEHSLITNKHEDGYTFR